MPDSFLSFVKDLPTSIKVLVATQIVVGVGIAFVLYHFLSKLW